MSQFNVPLILADLLTTPATAAAGTAKLYLNGGNLRLVRPDGTNGDLVLDRKLDAYKKAANYRPITPDDTVKQAIALLEARTSLGGEGGVLLKDITAVGTDVGGVLQGQTLTEGMSLTEIVERFLNKRITQGYEQPTVNWRATPYQRYHEIGQQVSQIQVDLVFQQNDAGARTGSNIYLDGTSVTQDLTYQLPSYIATKNLLKFTGYVEYAAGLAKPDNFGQTDPNDPGRVQAGRVNPGTLEWGGIHPWFYGSTTNTGGPSAEQIYAGSKVIAPAGSTLEIPSFGEGIATLWFAVPRGTPAYKFWFRTALNSAKIGSPQDLFGAARLVAVPSTGLALNWVQDYDVYVSNYPTGAVLPMKISVNSF